MAKPSMTEAGNSCHIHCSLWRDGKNAFWDAEKKRETKLFRQFLGGLLKYCPELSYFLAPTINAWQLGTDQNGLVA
jgi:glutamine synthetase